VTLHVRVIRFAEAHLPLPGADAGILLVAPAAHVYHVVAGVEEQLRQQQQYLGEDILKGVECGILGWVKGRAQRPVGARQGGGAKVWVAAAPAARVTWCVSFKHHSNAPFIRVFHEGNHVSVAIAFKLAVSGARVTLCC
jgi:hypothetical protein